jgi:Domain of unknown function (DUF4296)
MHKLIFFLLVIFLFSCGNQLPKGIVEQKKMEKVLWDILKVDTYSKNYIAKDSTKNAAVENAKMQQQIFDLYKITKEEFYKSYTYYLAHGDLIKPLLDTIINKASIEKYSKYNTRQRSDSAILQP